MKGRLASPAAEAEAIRVMTALNRLPEACLDITTVHAITDITGFGLLGHALEMATASHVEVTFYAHQVPVLAAAREYAAMGLVPAGSFANRRFCETRLQVAPGLDPCWLTCSATPRPTAACSSPWPRTRLRLFWIASRATASTP